MTNFTIHNIETAPEQSKPLLEDSLKNLGIIPNLQGVMAESPSLLEGYKVITAIFKNSSLNAEELTVVWQTINIEHDCYYCVPAHTAIAQIMGVDLALSDALRNAQPMPTNKLQALHDMTLSIVRNQARVDDAELEKFFAAGYGKRQLMEVVLGVSHKVMSNYVYHIAETPLDEAFAPFEWSPTLATNETSNC